MPTTTEPKKFVKTTILIHNFCKDIPEGHWREPIPAFAIGVVAYHSAYDPHSGTGTTDNDGDWSVSHIPTGLAFKTHVSLRTAKAIVLMLNEKFARVLPKITADVNAGVSERTGERIRIAINQIAN